MQYEPVEDEITGYVDSLLWHVWKCMDMYDQGPKLASGVYFMLLEMLHQAGFAHTDLRWENIILQHACQWVLIDLEFAYVLNSVPFTPEGHARKYVAAFASALAQAFHQWMRPAVLCTFYLFLASRVTSGSLHSAVHCP
ncbi:hypothetical protein WJX77_011423 [Trebouxia sp. C0004]